MKKLKVLGLAAAVFGMASLTSCLDDGNNTQQGVMYGVADILPSAFVPVVYAADNYPVYSTSFSSLGVGDCVVFYAAIDFDEQTTDAYYTATVSQCVKLPKYTAEAYVDTTGIRPGEMPITEAGLVWNFAKGHMFVTTVHPSVASDQVNSFRMMYNLDDKVTVDGNRVYEIWLRGQKMRDGSKVAAQGSVTNAFDASGFINRVTEIERAAGNYDVYFRFRYPSAFNSDTTAVTNWGASQPISFRIPSQSSNS